MRIGLICIATGEAYRDYARNLRKSAALNWPQADFILFSDVRDNPGVERFYTIQGKGYPNETLYRYHTMLGQQEIFAEYDQLFYADADMEFVSNVGDIYHDGIVATLHPGFVGKRGSFETRPASTACFTDGLAYYAGGFQGGAAHWYWVAAKNLMFNISADSANNITAVWHDESHWNKYVGLAELMMPTHVKQLTPSYCYPEDYDGGYGWTKEEYPPILVALDKRKRGNHPRSK